MENINAKEILEIAIQNENNGIKFYSRLREQAEDADLKDALFKLEQQENSHIIALKKLITDLLEENQNLNYYDDPEELMYLKAIADSSIFVDNPDAFNVRELFTDIFAALHYAVGIEIKSIEFYKQLLKVMSPDSGQETIQELIEQEKGHVKILYLMIKEQPAAGSRGGEA
jgi:rubrerythrin